MTTALVGGLLGATFGLGLVIVAGRLLVSRRPSLESRVAPYVRDVSAVDRVWTPVAPSDRPSSALLELVRPTLVHGAARLERLLGGRESVQRRLVQAGSPMTVEAFRFSQVVWCLSGFGLALLVGLLGPARQPSSALPWFVVCLGTGVLAILVRDSALSRSVRRREEQILQEFPVVADLLALAVAAGEGPGAALARVVGTCTGALPDELATVLAQSRTGVPLASALDAFALRSRLPVVSRFAEGFAVAVERGTPLVDVLNAQAADVREAGRRALIEAGARKEIAMMVPVVFLIMPVTLLFAFFPGVLGLRLLAS